MLLNQRLSKLYLLLTIQMQRFAYLVCMRVYVLERGGGVTLTVESAILIAIFVCVCVCEREGGGGSQWSQQS